MLEWKGKKKKKKERKKENARMESKKHFTKLPYHKSEIHDTQSTEPEWECYHVTYSAKDSGFNFLDFRKSTDFPQHWQYALNLGGGIKKTFCLKHR